MKRGWFPPTLDPTKIGALIMAVSTAVPAVVFAAQTKTTQAIIAAVAPVIVVLTMLGLVRPNVTPSSDPRDTDGAPLQRPDGTLPKGITEP